MTEFKSDLLRLLSERGHIHQLTDAHGLDTLASEAIVTAYNGYDATAPSLHVGNLASVMLLRRLQQAGHKPIALVGGGTTKIGDPSGKDESRKLLTTETIAANIIGISQAFHRLLDFGDGPTGAITVNNDDWLSELGYIDLLRNVGPHFTVNRMLTFDSVKTRLEREQPLTFLEFNYMILQAYDFRELALRHGCRLQLGGSDQWGNIVNGIELTRRMNAIELFGLTTPLLTTADGAKMGKSVNGAVWLNEDALPNYDFWQYWRNVDDRDVEAGHPTAVVGRQEAPGGQCGGQPLVGDVLDVGVAIRELLDPVDVEVEPDHVVAGLDGAQRQRQRPLRQGRRPKVSDFLTVRPAPRPLRRRSPLPHLPPSAPRWPWKALRLRQ